MSNNPKCPVFGCTIPRGIPHEHPAGVSAVMRDPVAPLTGIERAELERLRASAEEDMNEDANRLRESLFNQARGMQNFGPGSKVYDQVMGTNYYVAHVEAPMVPGRKLRDALMMAGTNAKFVTVLGESPYDDQLKKNHEDLMSNYGPEPKILDQRHDWTEVRRLSVVQIAGRIATCIVIAVGAASVVILMAMSAGWL